MSLTILYRSNIELCNYSCHYCPWHAIPKAVSKGRLKHDRTELVQVTHRLLELELDCEVFFVPKGENLVLDYYWQTVFRLLQGATIRRVTVQTNLSFDPAVWLDQLPDNSLRKLALWTTYHPLQASEGISVFLRKLDFLQQRGVIFSVGIVGIKEHFEAIGELSSALVERDVTLWVNAYKRERNYYSRKELEFLAKIDPTFALTNIRLETFGIPCNAGYSVLYLDGKGDIRRCLFVKETLGNIFSDYSLFERARPCPNDSCHCYLGHLNIPSLGYESVYGENLCVRIPKTEYIVKSGPNGLSNKPYGKNS